MDEVNLRTVGKVLRRASFGKPSYAVYIAGLISFVCILCLFIGIYDYTDGWVGAGLSGYGEAVSNAFAA